MSDPAISINNLSKCYHLGVISRKTLQDEVRYWWYKTRGKDPHKYMGVISAANQSIQPRDGRTGRNERPDTFWALKDISFDVKQGELLGIIGRNGAGKSTLLKILSRITEPTEGEVFFNGRVGSLLEVGTGFHPELTGRENIYMNGTILGMKKREIDGKFDEIVAFSEIGQFLDTPVKRYSSGMHVKLAFAVAAHLEPEILLVDEVLAVGDSAFQRKCLGKMSEVAHQGRTVLFVSHNMAAVENLCSRSILLDNGRLIIDSDTMTVIRKYMEDTSTICQIPLEERGDRKGTGAIRFTRIMFRDGQGNDIHLAYGGQELQIVFAFNKSKEVDFRNVILNIGIDDEMGARIAWLSSQMVPRFGEGMALNANEIVLRIPRLPLVAGRYWITFFCVYNGAVADWLRQAAVLDVETSDFYKTGKTVPSGQGHFLMDYHMTLTFHSCNT